MVNILIENIDYFNHFYRAKSLNAIQGFAFYFDMNESFDIKLKADEVFDYGEELKMEFYKAVSS